MANDHALVVGCGFGGIAAAGVLARHFGHVTIVERDDVPNDGRPRRGVPQSPHVHGILKLGRDILDGVFPGFVADAEADGAPLFDFFSKGIGYSEHGWVVRGHSKDVRGFSIRRAVLEHLARRRAVALPNVDMVTGRVDGLVTNWHQRVVGVSLAEGDQPTARIDDADLVVDCTGRTAQTPKWLEAAGFKPPAETIVNAFGGYASRYVHIPEEAWPSWWRYVAHLPSARNTKGALVYPQDHDFYIISLFGQSRDYPPGDEDGFDAFLAQCDVPMAREMALRSEPATEIRTSRATANRWRHFEDMAEPPVGYVVLGDAASTFNPMNGQGVSTACYGALTLEETLIDLDFRIDDLTPEFQGRLAGRMEFPWRQALGYDFKFPMTVGERPASNPDAVERAAFGRAIGQLATVDIEVAQAASLSAHLLDPTLLQTPEIVAKVKAWIAGGYQSPYADPTVPPPGPDDPKWSWID